MTLENAQRLGVLQPSGALVLGGAGATRFCAYGAGRGAFDFLEMKQHCIDGQTA